MSDLPATQTMLPLLESLLNTAIGLQREAGPLRLESIELRPGGAVAQLGLHGLTQLIDGTYRLELHLLESSADRTVFEPRWGSGRGLARLTGLGAKLLPRRLLNEALQRRLGGWLSVEGEHLIIDHAALIASLARGGRRGS